MQARRRTPALVEVSQSPPYSWAFQAEEVSRTTYGSGYNYRLQANGIFPEYTPATALFGTPFVSFDVRCSYDSGTPQAKLALYLGRTDYSAMPADLVPAYLTYRFQLRLPTNEVTGYSPSSVLYDEGSHLVTLRPDDSHDLSNFGDTDGAWDTCLAMYSMLADLYAAGSGYCWVDLQKVS
jgi:hypothetical protein